MSPLDKLFPYLLAIGLVFSALFGAYWYGSSVEKTKWEAKEAKRNTDDTVARLAAEVKARELESAYNLANQKVAADGQQQIDSIKVLLDSANARSNSVQQRANQLADKLASSSRSLNSCTTASSKAAADTARILADVFSLADSAAGVLVEATEQARTRGLICEKAYDSLVANSKQRK
jgi:septal ring factor EnvC (AmiA/AmiB activator)